MRFQSARRVAAATAIALLVAIVSQQLLASTPTVKGKGKVFQAFHAIATMTTFTNNVILVPDKQTLVVTDIIVTNFSANPNEVAVRCVGTTTVDLIPLLPVAADSTFSHSFSMGIECPTGTTLQVVPSATSSSVKVAFTGYFRKGS